MLHVFYDCISFRIYLYWTDNFLLKLANNFLTLQIQIAGKVVGCNLIGKRMKDWLEIGCTWQGNGMGIQIKKHKYKQNKKHENTHPGNYSPPKPRAAPFEFLLL
jgi:hypothetical protein